jgi:hypothetical protein
MYLAVKTFAIAALLKRGKKHQEKIIKRDILFLCLLLKMYTRKPNIAEIKIGRLIYAK